MKNMLKTVLVLLGVIILTTGAMASDAVNKDNPGNEIDISKLAVSGKITIFDFYSDYCPPCKKIAPYLKKLESKKSDIAVKKIDINRKGKTGIDWASPVTKQYKIRSVPYFIIYDKNGKEMAKGKKAQKQVFKYFDEAGIK